MVSKMSRLVTSLTPRRITELLSKNEINLTKNVLPNFIKSIECNQFASNSPIEDRLRISSLALPGTQEPTLIMGVFDGHGGGTTADIISRRLFNYIALSLHPQPNKLKISSPELLKNLVVDLHQSPQPKRNPIGISDDAEMSSLSSYREELSGGCANVSENLKASFKRCDNDLSREIQENLTKSHSNQNILHYYLSAAVSGCCALVMVVHEGIGYLASAGDCRAVLGINYTSRQQSGFRQKDNSSNEGQSNNISLPTYNFNTIELNDEHNCDNINEIRRLAASHPKSEQNTMIKNNRLLGHLMPFRAFGDFTYKWPTDLIKECGITRAFGSGVIPAYYNTPPYLIAEPDISELRLDDRDRRDGLAEECERYLVIASDGLWELFESSREVIETIVDHSMYASQQIEDYDSNCATHILRSALRSSGSSQDFGSDTEELRRLYHIRLESMLTLPQAVVRNFRDDISILVLKL